MKLDDNSPTKLIYSSRQSLSKSQQAFAIEMEQILKFRWKCKFFGNFEKRTKLEDLYYHQIPKLTIKLWYSRQHSIVRMKHTDQKTKWTRNKPIYLQSIVFNKGAKVNHLGKVKSPGQGKSPWQGKWEKGHLLNKCCWNYWIVLYLDALKTNLQLYLRLYTENNPKWVTDQNIKTEKNYKTSR